MTLPSKRRGGKRRTRHPMPDLTLGDEHMAASAEEMGAAVRMGPQAELCKRTMCCVCYVLHCQRVLDLRLVDGVWEVDWRAMPVLGPGASVPHHEPQGRASDDDDTVPLCYLHHNGGSFMSRHPGNGHEGKPFWDFYRIRYTEPRDEMRRRVREASDAR